MKERFTANCRKKRQMDGDVMVKVFLAEDEYTIREGIKKRIAWEENGFQFVGEADNGETAYFQIREEKPDILITDIKMPFMDGLELSKRLRRDLPELKILILSGYDNFSYARQAIQVGVAEYLLKPVTAGRLLESLLEVKKGLEEEWEQKKFLQTFRQEREENERILRYQFFNEMVSGRYTSAELQKKAEGIGISLDARMYNLVFFKLSMADYENELEYQDRMAQMNQSVEEIFLKKRGVVYFDRITEGAALLAKGNTKEELAAVIEKNVKEIQKISAGETGCSCFISVGKMVQSLGAIADCYYDTNKAFSYRFLVGGDHVIYSGTSDEQSMAEEVRINLLNLNMGHVDGKIVLNFLKNGWKSDVEFFVDRYVKNLGENNMSSLMFRQYIVMDLNFVIIQFLEELGWTRDDMLEQFKDFGNVSQYAKTLDMAKKYLIRSMEVSMDLREMAAMNQYGAIILRAKTYIQEHYNDDQISLNTVAASVNVSPNHFSRIFSQESGCTFVEYLTEIRMNKARELLENTDMKVSEVGYEVGYKDSHYFYYLFKKMQGCTPKDYRMKTRG